MIFKHHDIKDYYSKKIDTSLMNQFQEIKLKLMYKNIC